MANAYSNINTALADFALSNIDAFCVKYGVSKPQMARVFAEIIDPSKAMQAPPAAKEPDATPNQ